jgi:hypothetical protein
MARTFGAILTSIWSDQDFTTLPASTQRLYFLMLSFPKTTHAGTLPLTVRRWARTAPDATVEGVEADLERLESARFVLVDRDTEEVLIRSFIAHDKGYKIPNLAKSILAQIHAIESPRLRTHALTSFAAFDCVKHLVNTHKQPLAEGLAQPLAEGMSQPTGVGVGVGEGAAQPKNDDTFEQFWTQYPRHTDRKRAATAWRNLTATERAEALAALPQHVATWNAQRTATQHIPHPTTWLHGKRWEDEIASAKPTVNRTVTINGAVIAETAW